MQTPKARSSSSGAPQRTSPRSVSAEASPKNSSETTQKVSPRQLKTGPRYTEHTASSSNLASRGPNEASPKVVVHRSPRSAASSEKKRWARVSELESQISQLENDLEIVKDQLCLTEAAKKQAQKDAEESNQQLFALSLKFEESEKQLQEKSSVLEQDRFLHSELEAAQKQHSLDSAALASALDEIKQLKVQLELASESEAANSKRLESDQNELRLLKGNLSDTLLLVEDMRNQLKESKDTSTQAQAFVGETLMQLETAKQMVKTLKLDGLKATEAYTAVASELDQSKAHANCLEERISKFEADGSSQDNAKVEAVDCGKTDDQLDVEELKSAVKVAEIRYNEEQAQNSEKIRNAFELVEKIKLECGERVEELDLELKKSKYEIEELKANLMDKEIELQGIREENESLSMKLENNLSSHREQELEKELEKSMADITNLKDSLMDKEVMCQNALVENEKLKLEIKEISQTVENGSEIGTEQEALMKIGYMSEEVDKSNRKAARVAEQLEAAQAANSRMEGEVKRVKVQMEQWRKAAETAAAMLSAGNNGHLMERSGSLGSHYSPGSGKTGAHYAEELDDDLLKKKNANMLKRIGILWKKPQKSNES